MIDPTLKAICWQAVQRDATDIHLMANGYPLLRVSARLTADLKDEFAVLSADDVMKLAHEMYQTAMGQDLPLDRDVDFVLDLPDIGRFRVNVHRQRRTVAIAMRVIPRKTFRLEDLNLPPAVTTLSLLRRGLVLVTGDTGSGKSTTLAAMIEHINDSKPWHVVTLEDPVEYVLQSRYCAIEQREIGIDVGTFHDALRSVLRQDPDVVLVGEMRDLETVSTVLTIAETGHLVLSTVHTQGAPETVQRIVDTFPGSQQTQVRTQLARSLEGVVCQSLLPRADRPGLIPAIEVMICTPAVRSCIRENRLHELASLIETGSQHGMQTRDRSLATLALAGLISTEDALAEANNPEKLTEVMQSDALASWSAVS